MKAVRNLTAVVAATALAGGGLAAPVFARSAADDSAASGTTQSRTQESGRHHGGRRLSDAQLTTVATALGTTLDALKAAQAKVKAAAAATDARETKAQKDALLAGELNVTVTQLRAAFASVRGATDGTCKGGRGNASGTTAGDSPADTSTSAAAA
jgi:hypothetical protein